jgi:hypothetical protein
MSNSFFVPELKPADIVIMDNLGSHKGASVRRLPPYLKTSRCLKGADVGHRRITGRASSSRLAMTHA